MCRYAPHSGPVVSSNLLQRVVPARLARPLPAVRRTERRPSHHGMELGKPEQARPLLARALSITEATDGPTIRTPRQFNDISKRSTSDPPPARPRGTRRR